MPLTQEDRTAIAELIASHGHLVDEGELGRMGEVFTDDVTYDVTDLGSGPIVGLDALREAALALGDGNPVAHHVTNVIIAGTPGGGARATSKGLGVRADGTCASVTYRDVLARTPQGWRITHRVVHARRTPLAAS
ncbi:nuclear transport factor 2 family protein [Actinomadura graeca]|uniref:Nuclear transport factor 2 family protein n=1 Tax=Actinomadura graeca TaxID=2750812 RepID=A0ABX8R390_9ACTN|nr:nuclear transport factor 2 family protein [Actinomadura graeca]QXJ25546.1 nuclear transport factor 2 family protein [Actinomadura graeca]